VFRAHRPTDAATKKVHIWDQSGRPLCGQLPGVFCFHGRIVTEPEPKPEDGCYGCFHSLKYRFSAKIKRKLGRKPGPGLRAPRHGIRANGRFAKKEAAEQPPSIEIG
jgi:hypothetical protein